MLGKPGPDWKVETFMPKKELMNTRGRKMKVIQLLEGVSSMVSVFWKGIRGEV